MVFRVEWVWAQGRQDLQLASCESHSDSFPAHLPCVAQPGVKHMCMPIDSRASAALYTDYKEASVFEHVS